eukprot:CAMPEP_0182446424 /NCGR_PEP_ID=MMETSP1172-20130603/4195_1 /TAXON_ID=708627 /ORGANISM="Timspurckia oligopyrenoides, Strain CCMP3278" /LENGTH=49 /DNA_ID=CAMNT_0024642355 /DNA_START=118 /DNA_END=266 /DNA_ORIENTATION=+
MSQFSDSVEQQQQQEQEDEGGGGTGMVTNAWDLDNWCELLKKNEDAVFV